MNELAYSKNLHDSLSIMSAYLRIILQDLTRILQERANSYITWQVSYMTCQESYLICQKSYSMSQKKKSSGFPIVVCSKNDLSVAVPFQFFGTTHKRRMAILRSYRLSLWIVHSFLPTLCPHHRLMTGVCAD